VTLAPAAARDAAGVETPAPAIARACLNCGARAESRFCAECGQRIAEPDPTLREMAEELAGEVLHWDGKLWTTLVTLVRSPGALTLAYVAGRRASYVSPLKLYLTASVLYFFLAAVAPEREGDASVIRFTASDSARAAAQQENGLVVAASRDPADTATPRELGQRVERRIEQGVERAAKDPTQFGARIRDNMGTVVFVVLPAFAFAVGMAYRRQRRHFPQHVVFALHVHVLAFIGFSLSELATFTRYRPVETTVKLAVLVAVLGYIVTALRRVYGGSWPGTLAKAAGLGLVYLVFFGAGMIALALYGFMTV
jgi:hypothetical protein